MTQIFLPLKFPRRWSHPAKYDEGKKRAVPRRNEVRSKLSPGGPIPQNMARALMSRRFFKSHRFHRFTQISSKLSPSAMKPEASCPQAVPSRKIWRGLWCPANLRAKRFWAPEGGYILPFWEGKAWLGCGALLGKGGTGWIEKLPLWLRRDGVDRKTWRGGSKKHLFGKGRSGCIQKCTKEFPTNFSKRKKQKARLLEKETSL